MKKIYIAPKMETLEVKMMSIMAGSPKVYSTTLTAGEAESRRGATWDDEDDY